jgi:hypothetical protein
MPSLGEPTFKKKRVYISANRLVYLIEIKRKPFIDVCSIFWPIVSDHYS